MSAVTLTLFTKIGGPLTKRIYLGAGGRVVSDSSACVMSSGHAHRDDASQLAALINSCKSDQALGLGALRADLPDRVEITTKQKLGASNGVPRPDLIARTGDAIRYEPQQPGFALLDYDTKGMAADVAARIEKAGGFWEVLRSVLPALNSVASVRRLSTSAGLYRTDTGQKLPGSNGEHIYILVLDGADNIGFLKTLHDRCCLAGLGWTIVSKSGQLLERSIIDRTVGNPERLVFEGPPVLELPPTQDQESRRAIACDGAALDTQATCAPLSIVEKHRVETWRAQERQWLVPEVARVRQGS
jgi:hypothetical protein